MGIRRTLMEFKPARIAFNAVTYVLFRARLALATFNEGKVSTDPSQEPIPPVKIRWRVHGSLDRDSYAKVGKLLAQNIQDLCSNTGRELSGFEDILDFGCGCGRVIQNFRAEPRPYELYATDIDPELVGWAKKNLDGVHWTVNAHRPPLPFKDDAFDFIYGISVFTHLDEDFQHVWLRELLRVARPGATLMLTVHGQHVLNGLKMLDQSYKDEIRERGFLFFDWSKGRFKVDGFPDFYR